jgi:cell division protein FtsL
VTTHDRAPRGVVPVLLLLAVLGVVSLFFSALQYQQTRSATRADVDRNARLTHEVRQAVFELCEKAAEIATSAGLTVEPCKVPDPLDLEAP